MKTTSWKVITFSLLLLIAAIISPFLMNIAAFSATESLSQNAFTESLVRTFLFAIVSSIILICFGFYGALLMKEVPFFSRIGKSMGLMIFPIILGNLSTAFIFKVILGDSELYSYIVQSSFSSKMFYFILLQVWQFGSLFLYVFWLNFQNIPVNVRNYSYANKFSLFQNIKDIYYPHSKNLIILLTFVAFTFSLYEESKIQYLFKVSRGTDSELITNWLFRNYQSLLLINADYSEKFIFGNAFFILFTAIIVSIFLYVSINKFSKIFLNSEIYLFNSFRDFKKYFKNIGVVWCVLLLLLILVPVIFFLMKTEFSLNSSLAELGFPVLMCFLATLTSVSFAVIFGISSRLGWQNILNSFNNNSLFFFISLFLLMLIPPIVILICGFKWMTLIGYQSEYFIYFIWIFGHTILTLPILGSFVLFNHFRVTNNELNYLKTYKLKKLEIVKFSFLFRFKAEYILLFIIGFSFIWNDAILNNLFSDYIPSFASGLKMLITGRGADFQKAFGYLFVSFIIAISSVSVWRYIMGKASKLSE